MPLSMWKMQAKRVADKRPVRDIIIIQNGSKNN